MFEVETMRHVFHDGAARLKFWAEEMREAGWSRSSPSEREPMVDVLFCSIDQQTENSACLSKDWVSRGDDGDGRVQSRFPNSPVVSRVLAPARVELAHCRFAAASHSSHLPRARLDI